MYKEEITTTVISDYVTDGRRANFTEKRREMALAFFARNLPPNTPEANRYNPWKDPFFELKIPDQKICFQGY